ncbi:MAG TPA: glutamine amidotransferase [Streptosporangiaceae bacterium]|nr:glutamine amidotransferase [Streptosporangiaceae bacterium]
MTATAPQAVRICHLYPRLLSVAGDRGNLFAIMQRCAWRGISSSVTEADAGEVPDFSQSDLILLHGGQDREMTEAARDIAAKAGPLTAAIEDGVVVLAVCAGYQLLGNYYAPADGPTLQGIGVLDVTTEGGPQRFIGHAAVECDFGDGRQRRLTGFENHSGCTYLGAGAAPLGRMIGGGGNNGEDGTEGARYKDVYATYLHGPLLPKNPWLADHLIGRALAHRYADAGPLAPLDDQEEARAHEAALRLVQAAPKARSGTARSGAARSGTARASTTATLKARANTAKEARWTSR